MLVWAAVYDLYYFIFYSRNNNPSCSIDRAILTLEDTTPIRWSWGFFCLFVFCDYRWPWPSKRKSRTDPCQQSGPLSITETPHLLSVWVKFQVFPFNISLCSSAAKCQFCCTTELTQMFSLENRPCITLERNRGISTETVSSLLVTLTTWFVVLLEENEVAS